MTQKKIIRFDNGGLIVFLCSVAVLIIGTLVETKQQKADWQKIKVAKNCRVTGTDFTAGKQEWLCDDGQKYRVKTDWNKE